MSVDPCRPTPNDFPPDKPATPSRKTGRSVGFVGGVSGVSFQHFLPPEPRDPNLPVPTAAMPNKGRRVARRRRLLQVAGAQEGLFTTAQAMAAGLDRRARYHHLTYGNWRPTVAPRVFRLTGWPPDPHERFRAWLLWAGPGAHLTSLTALGLAGLIASGPGVPVDLEVCFGRDRAGRQRHARLVRQLDEADATRLVHLHPAVPGTTIEVAGLPLRPPAEAICATVNHGRSPNAVILTEALLDGGHLDQSDLFDASHRVRSGPIDELLLRRLVSRPHGTRRLTG